ncbi:smp protein [Pseudoalteromonas sp. MMG010]|uniref:AhpA/YtjB family protein n=1 Tax=Pseudoalteromonas sp. MMG010 TaxID=2822685 RepID=UPI001B39DD23|nr:AhpA/YtjB family protein [Pseudoalteromonas sp. MMG010]MBQ4831986.1 smp protein [Pseudoalteromonas sp. MMG010]
MRNIHIKSPLWASQKKRLLRLTLAAGCFLLLTWVLVNSSFQSHQLLYDSADNTAKSLSKFMALSAKNPLIDKNKLRLSALCNDISQDEFVLFATIYDQQGILLASSDNWQSHDIYGQLPDSTPGISKLKTPFVTPVIDDNDRPIGFVSITYLTRSAIADSHNHFHDLGRQVLLMLVIASILFWQLGRGVKRWQVERYIKKTAKLES